MARDILGKIIKTDIWGNKISKKQIKRDILEENKRRGQAGQRQVEVRAELTFGAELKKTGRGSDYSYKLTNPVTKKVIHKELIEVKTGNAKLSKLQKETKKKTKNYRVVREEPILY